MWQGQRVGSSKNPNAAIGGFSQIPIGMRLTKKRHAGMNNANVVNVMKKELTKRIESPRNRRQMLNNLAGPQSYSRRGVNGQGNAFLAGNPNMMNQTFTHMDMSGLNNDSMFAAQGQRTANRGVIAGKF